MQRDSRTGWYRDIDEYGVDHAISPEGKWIHILDAQRWLSDVGADLGLTVRVSGSGRSERQPASRQRTRQQGRGDTPVSDYSEAHWDEPPTDKQLDYLEQLGYAGPSPRTKREAGQTIDQLQPPPTEKQLDFLYGKLGYDGEEPSNKYTASKLIEYLIQERGAV